MEIAPFGFGLDTNSRLSGGQVFFWELAMVGFKQIVLSFSVFPSTHPPENITAYSPHLPSFPISPFLSSTLSASLPIYLSPCLSISAPVSLHIASCLSPHLFLFLSLTQTSQTFSNTFITFPSHSTSSSSPVAKFVCVHMHVRVYVCLRHCLCECVCVCLCEREILWKTTLPFIQ